MNPYESANCSWSKRKQTKVLLIHPLKTPANIWPMHAEAIRAQKAGAKAVVTSSVSSPVKVLDSNYNQPKTNAGLMRAITV